MNQFEQFGAGLLLRGIHILVALDDVQVDREPLPPGRQSGIPLRQRLIALRPKVPDGSRVLDQERKGMPVEQRKNACGIRPDGVAHPGVETVVHMRQDKVEVRLVAPQRLHLRQPILLHLARQLAAKVEKRPPRSRILAGPEKLDRVESVPGAKLRAHIVVHRREARGVAHALERLEIQLRQVHAIPIEPAHQLLHASRNGAETVAVGQVHELAPVRPELLAHVRQFQPGVDQNAFAMACLDQLRQVLVPLRIGLVEMPRCHMQRCDPALAPARRKVVQVHAQPIGGIEEGP